MKSMYMIQQYFMEITLSLGFEYDIHWLKKNT